MRGWCADADAANASSVAGTIAGTIARTNACAVACTIARAVARANAGAIAGTNANVVFLDCDVRGLRAASGLRMVHICVCRRHWTLQRRGQ